MKPRMGPAVVRGPPIQQPADRACRLAHMRTECVIALVVIPPLVVLIRYL
jgi:hypothetical protein